MFENGGLTVYLNQNFEAKLELVLEKRKAMMKTVDPSIEEVKHVHDVIMEETINMVMEKVESEWGEPPAHFAFFILGSGGRGEQLYWSDQDHGIVYEGETSEKKQSYFLHLGQVIVEALVLVGYEECEGKVMASNPMWCQSFEAWQEQIHGWLQQDNWENIRHTLTLFDAQTFIGEEQLVEKIKAIIFQAVDENPQLMQRFIDNTGRMKKGIGLFGQLLLENKGLNQGKLDLKQIASFPYVNGLRLLAIQEEIQDAATLHRFRKLSPFYDEVKSYEKDFRELLTKQLQWQKDVKTYESIHYLDVTQLSKEDKRLLKKWIKRGQTLYKRIQVHVEEG
ncbi:DUF294 nucleotidyltransferase-like domain-containing protein [Alkalihalobacillus pseudalcaliphilus]|uniref:DUF294 nucleotidyltransferase-like domain-containing protein n=1 Tax=Alkalihalobacillus pseudalcaliphilus TaxID=79884 RepID=UPI00064D9B4C|nr:DUF294 nucleotidyltransferase-like domain-containing protein [Alkalihalobacillus pseudalcaliphilus]KMK78193.1 hypothetical protein AB990_01795 [Alkalihalobacillus pseudalcaliphilus]